GGLDRGGVLAHPGGAFVGGDQEQGVGPVEGPAHRLPVAVGGGGRMVGAGHVGQAGGVAAEEPYGYAGPGEPPGDPAADRSARSGHRGEGADHWGSSSSRRSPSPCQGRTSTTASTGSGPYRCGNSSPPGFIASYRTGSARRPGST